MKYLRNKNTGKRIVYDPKLLELGYYEMVDDSQPEGSVAEPQATAIVVDDSVDEIKAAATKLLRRKAKTSSGGGINDEVNTGEEISIQLTRGE